MTVTCHGKVCGCQLTLERVGPLSLLAHNVEHGVNELSTLRVV